MILHTVNKPAVQSAVLEDCLALIGPDDALLLIEDGVLAALDTGMNREQFADFSPPLFVLREDVAARGLEGRLMRQVELVDYAAFVELCVRYPKIINWF